MRNHPHHAGLILVEFILITPVLLAIAGGAIEIARFLRFNQAASVLSQESALTAYRRCSDFFSFNSQGAFDEAKSTDNTKMCLDDLRQSMQQSINRLYPPEEARNPRFTVSISVYRRDRIPDPKEKGAFIGFQSLTQVISAPENLQPPSLYAAFGDTILKPSMKKVILNSTQVTAMERIVIAEVAYRYTPVIPIYRLLMGNVNLMQTDDGFRETTIL